MCWFKQPLTFGILTVGADAVCGGTGAVLLLVEKDGAPRHVCCQDKAGEEEVYRAPGDHVSIHSSFNL